MKKMLVIIPDLKSGGAEKSLINFLSVCDSKRYSIDLLLFSHTGTFLHQIPESVTLLPLNPILVRLFSKNQDEIKTIKKNHQTQYWYGLMIKVLGTAVGKVLTFGDIYKSRQMRWKIIYHFLIPKMKQHYDIVMAYLEGECSYYALDKVLADRKICWVHSNYNNLGYSARLDKSIFNKADAVVTISDVCIKALQDNFYEMQDRIVRLENISSEFLVQQKSQQDKQALVCSDSDVLLSIGRLTYPKGFDLAIDAAGVLRNKGIQFQWYIIGDGCLRNELEKKISDLSLEDHVKLLGIKENPYPYIANCKVFVQPSRYEGKSVVLDEAKILAKPIIVTNYPTVYDQIVDSKEGIIVEQTPESIAEGIAILLTNDEKREAISEYLSQHHYGNESEIEKYYEVFEGRSKKDDKEQE